MVSLTYRTKHIVAGIGIVSGKGHMWSGEYTVVEIFKHGEYALRHI